MPSKSIRPATSSPLPGICGSFRTHNVPKEPRQSDRLCEFESCGSFRTYTVRKEPRDRWLRSQPPLGPRKATAGSRRRLLVKQDLVGLAALDGFLLHRGDLLGGEVAGVRALDVGDPLRSLAGLGLVELHLAATVQRLVDLFEEGV